MNLNMVLAIGLAVASAVHAAPENNYTGPVPQMPDELKPHVRVVLFNTSAFSAGSYGTYEGIKQILELESRTKTVEQAMAVKATGLTLAPSLEDFLSLCQPAFSNPSDSYRAALSEFIAKNVPGRILPGDNLSQLLILEGRTKTIDHAIAVKRAGMAVVRSLSDFEVIARRAFSNPTDSYLEAQGEFIAANVGMALRHGGEISMLLELEGRSKSIVQARRVKEAGMMLVRRVEEFEHLTRRAFSNPSDSYVQMVSEFIVATVARAVYPDSDLAVVLTIEARVKTVDGAMLVKRAGLVAVHSREDLMKLARAAFSNPSQGYLTAVGNFIAQHAAGTPVEKP